MDLFKSPRNHNIKNGANLKSGTGNSKLMKIVKRKKIIHFHELVVHFSFLNSLRMTTDDRSHAIGKRLLVVLT